MHVSIQVHAEVSEKFIFYYFIKLYIVLSSIRKLKRIIIKYTGMYEKKSFHKAWNTVVYILKFSYCKYIFINIYIFE